jgi:hypothetical protein
VARARLEVVWNVGFMVGSSGWLVRRSVLRCR